MSRGLRRPNVAVAASDRERRPLPAKDSGPLTWADWFARSASARAETTFTPSRNRAWSRRRVRSSTSQRTSSWGRTRAVGSSVSIASGPQLDPAPQHGATICVERRRRVIAAARWRDA